MATAAGGTAPEFWKPLSLLLLELEEDVGTLALSSLGGLEELRLPGFGMPVEGAGMPEPGPADALPLRLFEEAAFLLLLLLLLLLFPAKLAILEVFLESWGLPWALPF